MASKTQSSHDYSSYMFKLMVWCAVVRLLGRYPLCGTGSDCWIGWWICVLSQLSSILHKHVWMQIIPQFCKGESSYSLKAGGLMKYDWSSWITSGRHSCSGLLLLVRQMDSTVLLMRAAVRWRSDRHPKRSSVSGAECCVVVWRSWLLHNYVSYKVK